MPYALLTDRATLLVVGEAATDFLQNLVTADLDTLGGGETRPAALLTPQGKILFDFLVSRAEGGLRLDVAAQARAALAKRLTLYRLRAKVEFTQPDEPVSAVWDAGEPPEGALADRRFPEGGIFRLYGAVPAAFDAAPPEAFETLRLRAGVAEAERDFPASDVFPHDVLLDWNGGVSFRKGCYVGQEVVSRMQHRGTARRRLMLAVAEGHLTPGAEIVADGRAVGTVLSARGPEGFAMVRIDRLAAALGRGAMLAADAVPVLLTVPPWAGYALPAPDAAAEGE